MTGPTKSTALAPMHGGEPYSPEAHRLAPHPSKVNELEQARKTQLGKLLLANESEFYAMAKVAGIPAEKLVLELVAAARKRPEILKCTEDSIMTFMFDAAKLGLQIGRGVYPVPVNHGQGRDRETRLEAWIGYHGAKELAMTSGAIRDCWAMVVFDGDSFEFEQAPVPTVRRHVPGPRVGQMPHAVGVYATLLYPGGLTRSKYFPKAKIEAYRAKNRGDTTKATSPWQSNPEEMWCAKAILHTTGDLPRTPRLAHLHDLLDRQSAPMGMDPAREVQPAPDAAALPAGSPVDEDLPDEPVEEPETMSFGVAAAVPVKVKGGVTRMLGELRNSHLERYRDWAREKLDADPDSEYLQKVAEGCTVLLDARARGDLREPPKRAAA